MDAAHSLATTMGLLAPHCPPSLVSASAIERVHAAAAWLPAALSRCVYIECRPDLPDAADLIVDVDDAGRAILAGDNPVIALDARLAQHETWARVRSFARAWSVRGDPLSTLLADVWLELDLDTVATQPAPSVFVDFSSDVTHGRSSTRPFDAILTTARHLAVTIDDRTARMSARCVGALPLHAMILSAGYMIARDTPAIRLCIMGLSRQDLPAFLRRVDWPGDLALVEDLASSFADPLRGAQGQPSIVHIDVDAGIQPRLGLEYAFARRPQLVGAIAEQGVLDELVARRQLTGEQRSGLDAWPGFERRTMPHELWPSILVRRVNHVKLVVGGRAALRTKVYLCAEHVREHRGSSAPADTK